MEEDTKKINVESLERACDVWSKVCSFLAGIFFASIILVVQQKDKFPLNVILLNQTYETPIEVVAFFLAVTFTFFVFAAISYADAVGARVSSDKLNKKAYSRSRTADIVGGLGFLSMFISLFFVLLLVSQWIAFLEVVITLIVFAFVILRR